MTNQPQPSFGELPRDSASEASASSSSGIGEPGPLLATVLIVLELPAAGWSTIHELKDSPTALDACAAAGINGIKGHRSVGGFRASMYNALPLSSVKVLVDVMKEFERTHG